MVAIWARLSGAVLLLALPGVIYGREASWPVKLWLNELDNLMLISGTSAGRARMTDITQPPLHGFSSSSRLAKACSQDGGCRVAKSQGVS